MATETKQKRSFFLLRAVLAFVLMAALIAGVYFVAYRGHPARAEWVQKGSHDAFVYEGDTYRRIGILGKNGLNSKKYPIGEAVGRVNDDGTPIETEALTLPPDAESGETVKRPRPDGDPTLARDHSYILYTVEKIDNMLLLFESDGTYALYYREVATWEDIEQRTSLCLDGRTYFRAGIIGGIGFSAKDYDKDIILGLVRNDHHLIETETAPVIEPESETLPGIWPDTEPPDYGKHAYTIYSVKHHSNLIIVIDADDRSWLFYREGSDNPAETVTDKTP